MLAELIEEAGVSTDGENLTTGLPATRREPPRRGLQPRSSTEHDHRYYVLDSPTSPTPTTTR